ncbi:MAG: sigma-70 family RNA polymerase sigma factor [Thermoanaerobaculia bacterium]
MEYEGITQLLQRWSDGDPEAAEKAIARVYGELHRIAAQHLRRERCDHTLQATAIVNEAYLRLSGSGELHWPSRAHFFAFASKLIRRILVDHSRNRNRAKRGGGWERVELDLLADRLPERGPDLVMLDEALSNLEAVDPRKAAVVELRFFGGLTLDEIGEQLGISVETAGREWRRARAWLYKELQPSEERV